MFIDPTLLNWIFLGSASFCAFMIGKNFGENRTNDIIECTILFLIHNNLVKWKKDENGEIELLPLDE